MHAAGLALGSRPAQRAHRPDCRGRRRVRLAGESRRGDAATDAPGALAAAAEGQREELADLLEATAGGGLADQPRLALADAVTGAMLTLTDLPGCTAPRTADSGPAAAARRSAPTT